MDDKTNLFIFSKKEVALIFLFMILIAIVSFVFGVKIGRSISFEEAGYIPKDKETVKLYSTMEEQANELSKSGTEENVDPDKAATKSEHVYNETYKMLEEEVSKLDKAPKPEDAVKVEKKDEKVDVTIPEVNNKNPYAGKFTIQLGSYDQVGDAQKFADGFRIRGYNPIINEVELKGRGTWYRVSLGVFDNASEAKEYILQEKTLFEGQDYVIARFD